MTPTRRDEELTGNRLLDTLPPTNRRRISSSLKREQAHLKQVLYKPGARIAAIYFPVDAVVSLLTTLSHGAGVELATIGNEGMVGSPLVLGSPDAPENQLCQVQVPGEILRMDTATFTKSLVSQKPFRDLVQLYVEGLFRQIAQQVACNALHSVEERCCRWLLLTHDRVQSESFPLTQEFLAQMLGVRRASVTTVAGTLQDAGLIRYRHGKMVIIDREGLENRSCECYREVRDEFDRLLGHPSVRTSARSGKRAMPTKGRSAGKRGSSELT